ncbi:3138_t:CDS:2, partial [Dentiscutata heterogama]
ISRDKVLLVNLKVKPEPGTNGDCHIQNNTYYKEFSKETSCNTSPWFPHINKIDLEEETAT